MWLFINSNGSEEKCVADKASTTASGYKGGVVGGGGRRRGKYEEEAEDGQSTGSEKSLAEVVSMIIHY